MPPRPSVSSAAPVHDSCTHLREHFCVQDGAAAVRQALACLFDSAMRKAEAARGALRGGATGSVILPSRVIFEAALEYGRSGAG